MKIITKKDIIKVNVESNSHPGCFWSKSVLLIYHFLTRCLFSLPFCWSQRRSPVSAFYYYFSVHQCLNHFMIQLKSYRGRTFEFCRYPCYHFNELNIRYLKRFNTYIFTYILLFTFSASSGLFYLNKGPMWIEIMLTFVLKTPKNAYFGNQANAFLIL